MHSKTPIRATYCTIENLEGPRVMHLFNMLPTVQTILVMSTVHSPQRCKGASGRQFPPYELPLRRLFKKIWTAIVHKTAYTSGLVTAELVIHWYHSLSEPTVSVFETVSYIRWGPQSYADAITDATFESSLHNTVTLCCIFAHQGQVTGPFNVAELSHAG